MILAALLLFCPLADTTVINGYHCWSYAVSIAWDSPQPCPPGLCWNGIAQGTLPHAWTALSCAVDEPGRILDTPDPADGELVMFSAEPNDVTDPNQPNFYCAPGGCADAWWVPSYELSFPCLCDEGVC